MDKPFVDVLYMFIGDHGYSLPHRERNSEDNVRFTLHNDVLVKLEILDDQA